MDQQTFENQFKENLINRCQSELIKIKWINNQQVQAIDPNDQIKLQMLISEEQEATLREMFISDNPTISEYELNNLVQIALGTRSPDGEIW
jgi:hypothetical protein